MDGVLLDWPATARRQAGTLTRAQCRLAGLTDRQVDRLLTRGLLRPTSRRAVLLAAGAPASAQQEFWRAVLSTGGVLSHLSAAECWQIDVPNARPGLHVTIEAHRRISPLPGVSVHRAPMPAAHRTLYSRLPVTTPARTVIDCLRILPLSDARTMLDRCLQRRLISSADLVTQRPGRAGNPQLTRLHRELTGAASEAERVMHRLFRAAGLTGWLANYPVTVDGQRCVIDVAFPAVKLAVEVDGWAFHSDVERFRSDRRRQNRLSVAGWRVVRFTWADLSERPEEVLRTITRLLTAASGDLATA